MEEDLREISPLYSVQLLFWSRQGVSSEHMTTELPSSAGQEKECILNISSKHFQRSRKKKKNHKQGFLILQLFLLHGNEIK